MPVGSGTLGSRSRLAIRPRSSIATPSGQVETILDAVGNLTTYTFDTLGRLLTVLKGGNTLTYGYDIFSNVTSIANPLDGTARTVAYEYDAAGRRTKLTYPDAFYVTYTWGVSTLTSMADSANGARAAFEYDDYGRRTKLTRTAGNITTYSYDNRSQLASLGLNVDGAYTTNDQTIDFLRNAAGQVTQRASSNPAVYDAPAPSAFTATYTNNNLSQLTASSTGGQVNGFQ